MFKMWLPSMCGISLGLSCDTLVKCILSRAANQSRQTFVKTSRPRPADKDSVGPIPIASNAPPAPPPPVAVQPARAPSFATDPASRLRPVSAGAVSLYIPYSASLHIRPATPSSRNNVSWRPTHPREASLHSPPVTPSSRTNISWRPTPQSSVSPQSAGYCILCGSHRPFCVSGGT